MAQALYRKYRSKSLGEVIGQRHITDVIAQTLKNGRISHAYLLTGPRGVGKTSIARIMAHEINKLPYDGEEHLDIIEIDAASNNGVDDVRDLREKVMITPASAHKKIYIIDEVHMLSKPAFNALLKTLEEPPEHVVFILATTEVHKLPDTILSRTQRFHFRPIESSDMKKHLKQIAKKEKIKLSDDALEVIAQRADGSFRDGISLLDQLSNLSGGEITAASVEQALGLAPQKQLQLLVEAITSHQLEQAIKLLSQLQDSGVSPVVLSQQLSRTLSELIVSQPQLIQLIDDLIEVGRSYNPDLKLLATIALAAAPLNEVGVKDKQKVVPALTPTLSITAVLPSEKTNKNTSAIKVDTLTTIAASDPPKGTPLNIEWPKVMEYVRANHPPLFGILKNAKAKTENNLLNLHFAFALHEKKLLDGRYRLLLTDSLNALYKTVPAIVISSGKLSPDNKQAQAVADIMGGGEEVNVN